MESATAPKSRNVEGLLADGAHGNSILHSIPDRITGDAEPNTGARLSRLYGPIEKQLGEVERRLATELRSRFECLNPLLKHGTQLGGKRLRPAMLLLSAAATGHLSDAHVVLGTVIELVHTATLIHDDVLDGASTRRHVPTVNAKWGNDTSILLGDYLFSQSFSLAATLGDTQACRWVGEAARRVCEGELRQMLSRDVLDLNEEDYIDIIRGKTAELCQVACRLGASYSGAASDVMDALGQYGDAVGIAFQIADDYLDLWGNESTVGKTLGTDLQQGKMTLPVIRMLSTASEQDQRRIVEILTGPVDRRMTDLRPLLQACEAREYTESVAEYYRDKAIRALHGIKDSRAKQSLLAIASFSITRRF